MVASVVPLATVALCQLGCINYYDIISLWRQWDPPVPPMVMEW